MLQHQIVQSPARLGLTNPNSPSIQNPTPPKFPITTTSSSSSHQQQQPPQQHHTPLTTSSALLPLLPPLPRAQSLLLQMASLATKLFDLSPNRSLWLSAFRGSLPTFLPAQQSQQPLPPVDPAPTSIKEVLALFTSLQTQLFESVAELQEILDLQDAKHRLARDIKAKDSSLLSFANKVKDAEQVLDMLVDDYADYRRPKRAKPEIHPDCDDVDDETDDASYTTVATQLKLSDILSYAHKISYTTFAPPEFGAGQAPLRGALPPAPQEEQMRASQLYSFADLDVGLPKSVESKESAVEAIIELPPPPPTPQQLADLAALKGFIPPNITVPSGWKPGMPVDLPAPPPGWKPGDAVPLESLPRAVDQRMLPLARPGFIPPETIQVKHVQIDIPDQDEDSDYSSGSGSASDSDSD